MSEHTEELLNTRNMGGVVKVGDTVRRPAGPWTPVRGGSWSGAFFSSTASTKWAYQTVAVEPANWYRFDAFVYHDDLWVASAFLRISWYSSS